MHEELSNYSELLLIKPLAPLTRIKLYRALHLHKCISTKQDWIFSTHDLTCDHIQSFKNVPQISFKLLKSEALILRLCKLIYSISLVDTFKLCPRVPRVIVLRLNYDADNEMFVFVSSKLFKKHNTVQTRTILQTAKRFLNFQSWKSCLIH